MSEYTLKELEIVREIPGNPESKGGPAKVYDLTLEDADGESRHAELFATARTPLPEVGQKIRGEIDASDTRWAPKWVAEGSRRPGQARAAMGRSPEESKRIVRQHSQSMAVQICAILGHVPDEETFVNYVNWFDDDVYGKLTRGSNAWPMTSDVPVDDEDLPTLPFEEKPER
jgi:hypothetical protein